VQIVLLVRLTATQIRRSFLATKRIATLSRRLLFCCVCFFCPPEYLQPWNKLLTGTWEVCTAIDTGSTKDLVARGLKQADLQIGR
jgi:hypothetical protein